MNKELLGNVNPLDLTISPVMHNHLNWVFDLETYATNSNAIVPEISAVAFDIATGKPYFKFSVHIDIDSQVKLGREVSAGTLTFWMLQKREAREKMLLADPKYCKDNGHPAPAPLTGAMTQLNITIREVSKRWGDENNCSSEPLVWGNGISFDLGKTVSLFESANVPVPWQYWAERDARTLMDLCPGVKKAFAEDFQGIPHYGLHDCLHELRYLSAAYNLIQKAGSILAESTNVKSEIAK